MERSCFMFVPKLPQEARSHSSKKVTSLNWTFPEGGSISKSPKTSWHNERQDGFRHLPLQPVDISPCTSSTCYRRLRVPTWISWWGVEELELHAKLTKRPRENLWKRQPSMQSTQ